MKGIKTKLNESLDDAVERLLAANANGEKVYLKYIDPKSKREYIFYSDKISLDSAYIEVYGATKEQLKTIESEVKFDDFDSEEDKDKIYKLTPQTVIEDVKMAKICGLIKNGKIHSNIAKDYIAKLGKYSVFCKETLKEEWVENIETYVYLAGDKEYPDENLTIELRIREYGCKLLKVLCESTSWDEISNAFYSCNLSPKDLASLGELIHYFSPKGDQFAKQVLSSDVKVKSLNNNGKKE